VVQKNRHLIHVNVVSTNADQFIWHIVYWVNLQHKSYRFTYLTYVLLLHYFGKQVKCIMITFSPVNQSYTLQLHSLKQHPAYLLNQS